MKTPSSRDQVLEAWAAFRTRDPDRVRAVFTPDAEWLAPPLNATALALGGEHHLVGRDRIVKFLTDEFDTVFVADVAIEFRGVYEDGDTVVVEETMRAKLEHGGEYENDYCFVFELEEGLVKRVREYMDTQRAADYFRNPTVLPPPQRAPAPHADG